MSSDPPLPPPIVLALKAAEYANASRSVRGRRGRSRWVDNFLSLRRFSHSQSIPESFQLLEARTVAPGEVLYLPPPPSKHQGSEPSSEAATAGASQTVNPDVMTLGEIPPETAPHLTYPVMGEAGKLIRVSTATSAQAAVQPEAMIAGETLTATELLIGKPLKAATASIAEIKDHDVMIIGKSRPTPRLLTAMPVAAGEATAPKPVADEVPAPSTSRKRPKKRVVDSGLKKQAKGAVSSSIEIIEVDVGKDISDAIRIYSLKRQHNICILGARGNISKAVLRIPEDPQPQVFEGELIIANMQGLFVYPVPGGKEEDRAGGMSLTVSGSTRLFGGGIAGSVIASSKVQLTVMNFTPSEPIQSFEASDEQTKAGN